MRRRRRMRVDQLSMTAARVAGVALVAIFAVAALASCGGSGEPQMAVRLSRSALSPNVASVLIAVHTPERRCADIENSGPDKAGSYEIIVAPGETGELHSILPNRYTVVVWTLDAGDRPLEFGCNDHVTIE